MKIKRVDNLLTGDGAEPVASPEPAVGAITGMDAAQWDDIVSVLEGMGLPEESQETKLRDALAEQGKPYEIEV